MTLLQRPDQGPHQRLMADQQYMLQAQPFDFADHLLHITLWRQPRYGAHGFPETQGVVHQRRRLLGAHVRAGDNRLQWLAQQASSAAQHLLAAMPGQAALGIGIGPRLCLTVAQHPQLHSLGSSSRTGCGAGATACGASPSGARGAGQSANGQGFCSV